MADWAARTGTASGQLTASAVLSHRRWSSLTESGPVPRRPELDHQDLDGKASLYSTLPITAPALPSALTWYAPVGARRPHAAVIAGKIDAGSAPRSRWTPGTGGWRRSVAYGRCSGIFRPGAWESHVGAPSASTRRCPSVVPLPRSPNHTPTSPPRTLVPAPVSTTTT